MPQLFRNGYTTPADQKRERFRRSLHDVQDAPGVSKR